MSAEGDRLRQDGPAWRHWGPYLSERAWGTVREDYSSDGAAWDYLPHEAARSHAYRWNEDGLGGISDDKGRLCLALALWNGRDPILKERLFGLTGPQGNHGEDVKECYWYSDSTPTHSYLRMLYKYPQVAFPYAELVAENARRGRADDEYELVDTGVFDTDRYFDVIIEYAKAGPDDLLLRVTAANRGPEDAPLWLLPTLWFRNTWAWDGNAARPRLAAEPVMDGDDGTVTWVAADHPLLGSYYLACAEATELWFTENDTNVARLYGAPNPTPYVKDAFHACLIGGDAAAINPARVGTKVAALYQRMVPAGGSSTVCVRLTCAVAPPPLPFRDFAAIFARRQVEADAFYAELHGSGLDADVAAVQRQAFAGLLWSKQFYHYIVDRWLQGDPAQPPPPTARLRGRNREWRHLYNERVMSMPDKWEYPWYAAWDLAFHCIPFALIDPEFAKSQLDLLMREWYMHPNGQLPAYEWAFGDVNPPVFAWAAWRVYKIDQRSTGVADRAFLERTFHKLLLNFNWWVNRKDSEGNNVFQGGFLGLDNIGVFDRSAPLPTGGFIEQSDGTSWMAMFSLNMMTIALELALTNPVYEDIATKFFEHFLAIAAAMNNMGDDGMALWDADDEFFYDVLSLPDGRYVPLKIRSLVGLIPLCAVETVEPHVLAALPGFRERLEWFLTHRPDLTRLVSHWEQPGEGQRHLLALVRGHRMKRLLARLLDETEFLSDYGVRSLSKYHAEQPYVLWVDGTAHTVRYEPGESRSGIFGGNSNWRGPVWFPINYLLIESLQKFHHYYSDDFRVECPTGSGHYLTLHEVADELARRLIRLFTRDAAGRRPFNGPDARLQDDPHWRDHLLFHEFFHGDDGSGRGASHQTGWTALVAKLIQQQSDDAGHETGISPSDHDQADLVRRHLPERR